MEDLFAQIDLPKNSEILKKEILIIENKLKVLSGKAYIADENLFYSFMIASPNELQIYTSQGLLELISKKINPEIDLVFREDKTKGFFYVFFDFQQGLVIEKPIT